jgi:hypothetical protein
MCKKFAAVLLTLLFISVSLSLSKNKETFSFSREGGYRPLMVTDGSGPSWKKYFHQGFNMRMWISNTMTIGCEAVGDGCGGIGPDGYTLFGLDYPVGSGIEHLYGGGPWFGALVNGTRHVDEGYNGDDARTEFQPNLPDTARDRMWMTSTEDTLYDANRPGFYKKPMNRLHYDDDGDGKVDEDELDGLDNDGDWNPLTDDIGADGVPDTMEVGCKGKFDPVTNPDPAYDDYLPTKHDSCHPDIHGLYPLMNDRSRYTEKNGLPDHGEPHVDEDYGAVSDQDVYCASTDTFSFRLSYAPDHFPMGMKVFFKSYAWRDDAAQAILPLEYYFVNVRKNVLHNVYVGWFADMDVGPYYVGNYAQYNYAAYDSTTRTGYIVNPIDWGSTPSGLTLLGASKPLDSLQLIWQWHGWNDPGTIDSLIYARMSWEGYDPAQRIKPNQSPANLFDTRFYFSLGPFPVMNPGDTVRADFALVSGYTISDMLNYAARAKRIYAASGYLMPNIRLTDRGAGQPVTVSWTSIDHSPFGKVMSYRIYYGTHTGQYTDSLTTDSTTATLSGFVPKQTYFFAVRSIDDKGNFSALSDELSTAPLTPSGVAAVSHQRTIELQWNANTEADFAGYNVYRHSTGDTVVRKLTGALLTKPGYLDSTVWGNQTYYYRVTSVDRDSLESAFSQEISGHLIPPSTPANFVIGPGRTSIHLAWLPNSEGDFAGYNVYRSRMHDSGFVKLNASLRHEVNYTDSTIQKDSSYYYYVEAVDTTDAVSPPTSALLGHTVHMDQAILLCSVSMATGWSYDWLLRGFPYHVAFPPPVFVSSDPNAVYFFGNYSTVLWIQEMSLHFSPADQYPLALKGYLLGGGNLLVMGQGLPSQYPKFWLPFLSDFFGINAFTQVDTTWNFAGAFGFQGFPSVTLDQQKLAASGGRLNYVERLAGNLPSQVIYTYHSSPFDSLFEGKPVGLRAMDSTYKSYYLSFSLYNLDSSSAKSLMMKILSDFNEVTEVRETGTPLPKEYRLYDAYPNPFNPSTTIRFDLPKASDATLIVYDLLGREVTRLTEGRKLAGSYEVTFNAEHLASGVYFYRLTANEASEGGGARSSQFTQCKRLLLLK